MVTALPDAPTSIASPSAQAEAEATALIPAQPSDSAPPAAQRTRSQRAALPVLMSGLALSLVLYALLGLLTVTATARVMAGF